MTVGLKFENDKKPRLMITLKLGMRYHAYFKTKRTFLFATQTISVIFGHLIDLPFAKKMYAEKKRQLLGYGMVAMDRDVFSFYSNNHVTWFFQHHFRLLTILVFPKKEIKVNPFRILFKN